MKLKVKDGEALQIAVPVLFAILKDLLELTEEPQVEVCQWQLGHLLVDGCTCLQ